MASGVGDSILDGEIGNDEFYVIASGGNLVDGKVKLPPMMDQYTYTPGAANPVNRYSREVEVDRAETAYWDLTQDQQEQWRFYSALANDRTGIDSVNQGYTEWERNAKQAAQYGQQTGETQDLWGFMIDKISRRDLQRGGSGGGGGGGGGGVPLNTTTRQVDLSSPGDARDLLERSLAAQLGRRPTKKEYGKFFTALTGAERENPRVVKTRRSADGSSQSSVVQQGLNREQYGQEYAQMDDDFMDTQAVNNAGMELLSLLGGA